MFGSLTRQTVYVNLETATPWGAQTRLVKITECKYAVGALWGHLNVRVMILYVYRIVGVPVYITGLTLTGLVQVRRGPKLVLIKY